MNLWLMLSMGQLRCALPAREVVRVVHRAQLHPVAGLPPYLAGRLNFEGQAVPVLDLCQLTLGRECAAVYSTRIVIVDYPYRAGQTTLLGLMAEKVTEASRRDSAEFRPCALDRGGFLAQVSSAGSGDDLINALRISELLSPELRASLFEPASMGAAR